MRCLVLFGAGASFGSQKSGVPPLGSSLFDALCRFDPNVWGRLPATWQSQFRKDFEAAMASFISSGHFAAPLQWKMAEYFFSQFHIQQDSLYLRLLERMVKSQSPHSIATLNYDLLLQQAASCLGIALTIGQLPQNGFHLILPHGSCNIRCDSIQGSHGVSFTGGVSTGGSVSIIRDFADFYAEQKRNVFPPVMSYFEPNKFTVSCSNFIEKQRNIFSAEVASASSIAIIGVRVHIVDMHIWGPLAATKAKLMYVGGPQGASEFADWSSSHGRADDQAVPLTFADSFSKICNFLGC